MISRDRQYPQRIVCLTEETTEFLYLLGCEDLIAGISGFTVRPPRARTEKPKVSTFLEANVEEIVRLKPDLVLAFSDLQAEIVAKLLRRGLTVMGFNQRSLEEILGSMEILGRMVNRGEEARHLTDSWRQRIESLRLSVPPVRPSVYFEEWKEPLISCIRWVSELIEVAGGEDVFRELRGSHEAQGRVVDPAEVVRRNPDIIIGSWCGRPFKRDEVMRRPGWEKITAVQTGRVYEIDSSIILQPGPAALTDGLDALCRIVRNAAP